MPTKMDNPRELFLHELGDLLYAENVLVKTLPKLAKEASDAELQKGFESHLEETKQHVDFMSEEMPSPEITDMFLTGSGARAEHYEIAAYTGLITMAQALGETGAVPLLQDNLKQEKAALDKLEKAATRLSREHALA
jgi:ferritin-like metal-binding protein YciE